MGGQIDGVVDVTLTQLGGFKQHSFLVDEGATKGDPICV